MDAPELLGKDPGHPAASTLWVAAELLGCEAGSSGVCTGVKGSREAAVSGGRDGSKVRVSASLSDVLAPDSPDPVAAVSPGWLETAADAVEILKILANRDPRSNTATFMPWSWRGYCDCHKEIKDARCWAAELHPLPPVAIWIR